MLALCQMFRYCGGSDCGGGAMREEWQDLVIDYVCECQRLTMFRGNKKALGNGVKAVGLSH